MYVTADFSCADLTVTMAPDINTSFYILLNEMIYPFFYFIDMMKFDIILEYNIRF